MKFKEINSSNLKRAAYDASTQILIVEFQSGAKYRYANISPTLHANFERNFDGKDGRSAGRFFNKHIRNLPCEKIEE